jgi:hypothetical protein
VPSLLERMLAAWRESPLTDEQLQVHIDAHETWANMGRDVDWNRAAAEALTQIRDARGTLEGWAVSVDTDP